MPVGAIILVVFCFLSSPTPLGMRKSSQLATAFWLLVRASATVQSNTVTSNGVDCVRFYLPNMICLGFVFEYGIMV